MRKLLTLGLGVAIAASMATSAFAGPTRAIVQEMGSVAPAGEVQLDMNVIPLNLTGAAAGVTAGGGNATIGGTALSSVNVGLGNGFEIRTGTLPGLLASTNLGSGVLGVTVKYAGFMPGLSVYGAYGSNSATQIGTAVATNTSANRIGVAYTTSMNGFVLNGNVQMGNDSLGNAAGQGANSTEIALAALYPLTPNILVGGEYLNTGMTNNAATPITTNVSGFALGGRATIGHFTVDAVLLSNITVTQTNVPVNGTSMQMGNPALVRVNYTF